MPNPAPITPSMRLVDSEGRLTSEGFRFLQNLRGVVVGDDGSGDDGISELNERLDALTVDAEAQVADLTARINTTRGRIEQVRSDDKNLERLIQSLRAQTQVATALLHNLKITAYAKQILQVASEATFKALVNLEIGTDVQAYHARLADIAGITYAQGDVFYYNGSNIVKLAAGTSGNFLKTNGAGANPAWAAPTAAAASIHKNGTNQSITGSTFTKATFSTAEFDTNSWFDDANDRLTVGAAGKYLVSGLVTYTTGITAGDLLLALIRVNGSTVRRSDLPAPGTADTAISVTDVLNLSATNYVELWAYKGGANSVIYGSAAQTYLSLAYLGA